MSAALATKEEAEHIKLTSIIADKKLWPRRDTDPERVEEFKVLYKEEPEVLPPIIVAKHPTQEGKYRLVDGWHRVEALKLLYKETQVEAKVLPKDTDVYLEATRLSAINSKPLTILEKRAAVRRLLDEHKDWSNREIARIAGVSDPFVGSQRKKLTRLAGEAKDAVKKALEPSPDATRSAPAKQEEPGINQLLFNIIQDQRAGEINLDIWRNAAAHYPQFKPVMRHVATVLFQASQDAAPALPGTSGNANVSTGAPAQKRGMQGALEKYQQYMADQEKRP